MTLLVAGHETTASELAWAFERLVHSPEVVRRLADEIDAGESDDYLLATVQETLRRRPVLPNAAPRMVKQPAEIGGWEYEPGAPRRRRARAQPAPPQHRRPAPGRADDPARPPAGARARARADGGRSARGLVVHAPAITIGSNGA